MFSTVATDSLYWLPKGSKPQRAIRSKAPELVLYGTGGINKLGVEGRESLVWNRAIAIDTN